MVTRAEALLILIWATATAGVCWAIGELQAVTLLAAASLGLLWMFMLLWRASTLGGAVITFGAPAVTVVAGALLFAMGYRMAGSVVLISTGVVFPVVAYRVLMHWGHGRTVAGLGAAPPEIDALLGDGPWVRKEEEPRVPVPLFYGMGDHLFDGMWPPVGAPDDGVGTNRYR